MSVTPDEVLTDETPRENNLDLIYDYSLTVMNWEKAGIQSLNSRLTMAVAFGGVLLRFAVELEDVWRWVVCGFVVVGIVAAVLGLRAKATGILAMPQELLDEWYVAPQDHCKIYIAKGLGQTTRDLLRMRYWKAKHLNVAVVAMLIGLLVFGVAVVVG